MQLQTLEQLTSSDVRTTRPTSDIRMTHILHNFQQKRTTVQ